ncbi:hypothetical protein COEREDRAFT_99062 [Coemansia reversa NRRL 1564]|uniref:F-box domain-containing protein n=1 Tax=Coemansia reversa (strain ATCC 12441 / NRRL 1564) TaxID=763665 RepID=A0A2G5B5I0_COERN|nr:hypothetical protein COEREDRAFT_99062 [Coemansia reversa NRRL 1564]|eukprot:PIA14266.1 hypothetical protein COEREDRAFT_99062 [Coemansia reversa NRRL 1564]
MAQIDDFPYYILNSILYTAATSDIIGGVDIDKWKQLLPLLGVCRRWSKIALPFVYQYAIARCNDASNQNFFDTDKPFNNNNIMTKCIWTSNIECIVQRKAFHYVKSIYVTITSDCDWLLLCKELATILDLGNIDWSGVQKLSLHKYWNAAVTETEYNTSCTLDKSLAADIACLFVRNIPNVIALNINVYPFKDQLKMFVEVLANAYTNQLQILTCYNSIHIVEPSFGSFLTRLEISLDTKNAQLLPYIYPKSLQFLILSNVPTTFSWQFFSAKVGDREIIFESLIQLYLIFVHSPSLVENTATQTSIYTTGYYQLIMPKIKRISIYNCPINNDILFANFDSPYLQDFIINGEFQVAEQVENLEFYASRRFQLDIPLIKNVEKERFYTLTNNLFGGTRRAQDAGLSINCTAFEIDDKRIKWDNLGGLNISSSVSYSHLSKLISRLPSLHYLTICDLAFSNREVDMLYQNMNKLANQPVVALHTNIERLQVGSDFDVYSIDMVMAKLMYLVLRIHSLTTLLLDRALHARAREFIDQCKTRFPHLANITVKAEKVYWLF